MSDTNETTDPERNADAVMCADLLAEIDNLFGAAIDAGIAQADDRSQEETKRLCREAVELRDQLKKKISKLIS